MKLSMNTLVSLLVVAVVPSVQAAGWSGVGCPPVDGDLTIEEGSFCNHGSGTAAQPMTCCPGNSNVEVPWQCDRSNGDASGGTWYVELHDPNATHNYFFLFFFAIEHSSLVSVVGDVFRSCSHQPIFFFFFFVSSV